MSKTLYGKIFRFLIAGGASTAFMFGALLILHELLGVWYLASSAIAFTLTLALSFMIQKFWAFKDHSLHTIDKQFYSFLILGIANLFANIILMYVLVETFHIWYIVAQVITMGFIATWDFLLYHFLIFPHKENDIGVQSNSSE